VRLAVGGDRAAFGALVAPQVAELTRLCRRVAGPALAEDCVQDTLLLALLRLPALRDSQRWRFWLRGIAVRVCRRARARGRQVASLPEEEDGAGWGLVESDAFASLDAALAASDLAWSVRAAVAALPGGQRRAVELFYLRGLSYDAVAGELDAPVGAVKSRLHKARAALAYHYRLSDGPRPARPDDRTLSVHEAAHAVAGWQEGERIERVAITPRAAQHLGCVELASNGGLAPAARLLVLMAGEAGVARDRPRRPGRDSGDRDQAARVARAATGGDEMEAALYVAAALRRAAARFEDARTWTLVERVRAALVARRELDGDALRAIVTR
jgi:RNA polymerase sigma-70 factor (ECF subfamily)